MKELDKFEGELENADIDEEFEEYDDGDIVMLVDEDGNEGEYQLLDFISYNDTDYAVLCSADEDSDSGRSEVVILKVEDSDEDDDYQNFVTPDSDEEYNAVFELFREKFKDVIDFEE